ncbi:MAG: tetratricopeptide repeat protein [Candidatus Atribacteria bacterium]|nr:MAG: tetratricopeptide repeat protein [Candidatus Atribacteria bacterium]
MKLSLQLFGAPVLYENGEMTPLSRRKAMALLSYLAVTRSRHHRETLAALLWPESDAVAAYSALRNVLWILRQTPLSDAIASDRSAVQLRNTGRLEVDVNQFRDLTSHCHANEHGLTAVCSICEPRLREAVRLWQGPFMQGFAVANSGQFDDWQFAEGEALKRELTETLDRIIEYYFSIEEWPASARYARKWIQADPLNELGYRRLMQAMSAQGKRSDALRVFEECSHVLQAELGLSPEESTSGLAEQIRATQSEKRSSKSMARPHRLPHALVPFIGRQEIAAQIEALLLEESVRVVNIVGLGGSGKTSLALHVGRRIEDQYELGAYMVSLDAIRGDDVVASTVAHALGVSLSRESELGLVRQLAEFLRIRNLLLILDGVERVLPQVAALLPALETAPGVQLLLTSRIALGVACETAITLHGLKYPDADTAPEQLSDYAAIRLLRISAQRHGSPPGRDEVELAGMARLARLLEGSPLGLEMAAGWRSVLTWDEIANRISNNLSFLTHTLEDVALKHRAFVVVFEQAWNMLTEGAQVALRKLSTFRSSFTIEAAEYVTETSPSHLALLANRCLLKRIGPDRYEIHELLRQFASGKLGALQSEVERVHIRHAEHYLHAVGNWLQELIGPNQYATLERIGQDIGNIRSAFQHAAEIGNAVLLNASCEGLFFYYDMRTQYEEAERIFLSAANAYAKHEDRDPIVYAFLRITSGWFMSSVWPDRAMDRMRDGLSLLTAEDLTSRLHALANVVCAYALAGEDLESDLRRAQESAAFYREHQDMRGEGLATGAWSVLESRRDEAYGESLAHQSLRLHREIGDRWGEGLILFSLARVAEAYENLELALARYEESQRLGEAVANDVAGVVDAISGQARVTRKLGELKRSEELAERALQLSREIGDRLRIGQNLLELAYTCRQLGNCASARELLEEAFSFLGHRKWSHIQAECALALMDVALDERSIGAAERWYREASMLQPEHPALHSMADRLRELRKKLSE